MKGQSLFEVLAALLVIGLIVVGVVSLSTTSVRNTTFSRSQTQANRYNQELIEWLRSERDKGWADFKGEVDNLAIPNYCFNTLSWGPAATCTDFITGTIFKREGYFSCAQTLGASPPPTPWYDACDDPALNIDTIQVQVRTHWTDAQGSHDAKAETIFANN